MRELTDCQAKNSTKALRLSASFQLQPPWENLQTVKPRIPQEHQDCQLHFSSSHMSAFTFCQTKNSPRASRLSASFQLQPHEWTYLLSNQEFPKSIKTVNFISAQAIMRELTHCQAKNSPRASKLLASFQLQPPCEILHSVKPRIPQEHQDCQLPALATMRGLTCCQAKNAQRPSRLSSSFYPQPP